MNCKCNKIITNRLFFSIPIAIGIIGIGKNLIKLMARTFIFLFSMVVFSLNSNHVASQNERIVIDSDKEITVDAVFKIIKAQTDYTFVYDGNLFENFPRVSLKKGSIRLNKLLDQSLSAGGVHIIFTANNNILIKVPRAQQQLTVKGTVKDESGLPIPGATVLIKGTSKGTATNLDGQYSISVPDPAHVLVFSSLGFEIKEITVGTHLPAGQAGTTINIVLKEAISQLDEVTIRAGYYNTSQREKTGSIGKIDAKTIEKQPVSNPLSAMTGYIPGVDITQDSGVPGGGFNIRIRGKNFLNAGTDPLFLVDGVPYSSESLVFSDAQSVDKVSPLNLINPADIESIEVLKDADATAIYGSRGANGVVLITTKKGETGKTQFKLNAITSLAAVPRSSFIDLMNTEQYLEMRLEALANDGYTLESLLAANPAADRLHPDLYLWDQNRYTNWQEVFTGGTAYRKTAQLSVSGGNSETRFLVSGGYQNENTVFLGDSYYSKATVHSNINHQSANKRFKINLTTDYVADDKMLPTEAFSQIAYHLAPNAPALYDENGDLNWENNTWKNPLSYLERKFHTQSSNLLMNAVMSYHPMADLELKVNLGFTDYGLESYNTRPLSEHPIEFRIPKENLNFIVNTSNTSWIMEPQIHWKKDWEKIRFSMLIGTTFQQKKSKQFQLMAKGFATDSQILDLSAADQIDVRLDQEFEYKYQAVFGRLNVNWADKYIVNLTGRRDGSSRFGPGRQFGNFGALGMAWLFSEEAFLEHNSLLSFGKIRASYGITGSDQTIGDYGFYETYETFNQNYDGSVLVPTRLFNPDFGWEENKKFEAALELGFFKNRLMLTTAWYKNRSSNQLVGIPLPGTTGFSSVNANFDATVQNTGLEIDLRSVNIDTDHLKWTTTFNISIPRNKLVKFDGLETSTFRNRYIVGAPITIALLYQNTGVNPDTGLYGYKDYNNDGEINRDDEQLVEDLGPKFFGGLGNTLNYKNWTLDVFFQFKKHRANILQTIGFLPGIHRNTHISILDRWQQVGDQAPIQQYTLSYDTAAGRAYGELYRDSNVAYTDASFIRLRNVALSYTVPKTYIQGLDINIYLQGQNLLTFTNFIGPDPDQSNPNGNLPLLRQFTLGLQLGF